MRASKAKPEFKRLPLALIDEPEAPIRETFDPQKLEWLAESIKEVGVLEPILVQAHNGRFRIHAGHRRYVASGQAGLTDIPALILPEGDVSSEAITVHENAYREDVNPGEEASYLGRLLERCCEGDVDKLCALTRQKRVYVEDRLLLLQGDPKVLEVLKARAISFAVARELNKVEDQGYRWMFLDAAARGGASVRIVREWRIGAALVTPVDPPPPTDGTNQFTGLSQSPKTFVCLLCESDETPWEMELVYMHKTCRRLFLERFLARLKGEAAARAEG